MPCRLSSLIPAIVAGALAGAGIGWLISMAEWAITGDRPIFGFGGAGYISLVIAGAIIATLLAYRSARRAGPASCAGPPLGHPRDD